MRYVWLALWGATLGSVTAAAPAHAAIKVVVRWSTLQNEVAPLQQVHHGTASAEFALESGHVVTREYANQADARFDQQSLMTNKHGSQYLTRYAIRGGRITRINRFPGFSTEITVSTDGVNGCSATVVYRKVPGQRYFTMTRISNNEQMFLTDITPENISCRISNQ